MRILLQADSKEIDIVMGAYVVLDDEYYDWESVNVDTLKTTISIVVKTLSSYGNA